MREISIHINSTLYRIYRDSLSRWEHAPTRASLPSFAYVILSHTFRKHKRYMLNVVLTTIAMLSLARMIGAVTDVVNLDELVTAFMAVLCCTSAAIAFILSCELIYSLSHKRVGVIARWVRRMMSLPEIRFVGYPDSMYDIEKFSK